MPRVTFVKKARKDNPAVKAGESYYWWKFRYGGKHYSRKYPRPSQLTQAKISTALSALEEVEDYNLKDYDDLQGFSEFIREQAETVREVAEEYRESGQNIEDGFGHETYQSQELLERADEVEQFADDWDNTADEVESIFDGLGDKPDEPDEEPDDDQSSEWTEWNDADDTYNEWAENLENAIEEARDLASGLEVS